MIRENSLKEDRSLGLKERALSATPEICVERARYLTESFRATEGQPRVIRLAKAFRNVLDKMTIFIQAGEIIVGNRASKPGGSPLFPETQVSWLEPQLDVIPVRFAQRFQVSEETKRELKHEIIPYWTGNNAWERALELMPYRVQKDVYKNVFVMRAEFSNGIGHFIPGHGEVVRLGLGSVRKRAEYNLRHLKEESTDSEGADFLRAVIITIDAAERFAGRFAEEAERLAGMEKNPVRREELLGIARACRQVPMNPARDLHEGIQAVWFNQLLAQIEDGGFAISVGRLDQILSPLYSQDVETGKLTPDGARELIECFYVKLSEVVNCLDTVVVPAAGGPPIAQNVTVGGLNAQGDDATCGLSYLCIDAMERVRTVMPNLSVRFHGSTPEPFLEKACRAAAGGTMLGFFNDEAIIPAMMNRGYSIEDARRYAIVGCVEPSAPGMTFGSTDSNLFNIAKCLELALNDGNGADLLRHRKFLQRWLAEMFPGREDGGKNGGALPAGLKQFIRAIKNAGVVYRAFTEKNLKLSLRDHMQILGGRHIGPRTGKPGDFGSIDRVIEAYRQQVAYFVDRMVQSMDAAGKAHAEMKPTPFISSTISDCIENARDVTSGGARYNFTGPQAIGLANAGNSLAAIDRHVFGEKSISLKKLVAILDDDFDGAEPLRRKLAEDELKYGNDCDHADRFAGIAARIYCEEVEKHANYRGGWFQPGIYSITGHIALGALTGTTPDGRRGGTPLAEGISPARGTERNGPTAVLKSAAKLDTKLISNGLVLNMRFQPHILRSEESIKKFAAMNRTYFQLGGMHVQYNIIDQETLKKAQANPEDYRDLVVRVAGYSALFTELDTATQNDIISRTCH